MVGFLILFWASDWGTFRYQDQHSGNVENISPTGGYQGMMEMKCWPVYTERILESRIQYEIRVNFHLFRVLLTSLSI